MPLSGIPVLALVALVFALVVAATAKNVHLGLAALAGGLVFALLRGLSPLAILRTSVEELLDPDALLLLVLVTAIMMLSAAMKASGALAAFSRAVGLVAPAPRASLALTPLLIGTLPMPGGAILSAPLVEALDPERKQGGDGLSAINYWFRHVLELTWPLYPSFILVSVFSGLSTSRLIVLNLYSLVTLLVLGQIFVFRRGVTRGAPPSLRADRAPLRSRLGELRGFLPLALLLGFYLLLDRLCTALLPGLGLSEKAVAVIGRYLPTLGGVAVASLYVALAGGGFKVFRGALSPSVLSLVGVIAGIRVFAALLEAGGIAGAGSAELKAWGIPPLAVAAVLPFVSGLVTGVGFAYVGIAFPIVLGLFPAGSGFPAEAALVLAWAFGYAGMMLSPLHVCLVVTARHFGAGLLAVFRRFALPLLLFLLVACAWTALLAILLRG